MGSEVTGSGSDVAGPRIGPGAAVSSLGAAVLCFSGQHDGQPTSQPAPAPPQGSPGSTAGFRPLAAARRPTLPGDDHPCPTEPLPLPNETLAVHAGQSVDPTTKARAVPIYATTSYVFDNADHAARLFGLQEFGNIYTRIMNPTTDVFEQRIAALEGGVGALGVASGQAAETLTILSLARAGDNFVTSSSLYGGTYNLFQYTLPKYGIEFRSSTAPSSRSSRRRSTARPRASTSRPSATRAWTCRTSRASPKIAHKHGVPVIVDNTFAPILSRPFEWGVDIVVHSATKWIGGHGTAIGGVVVDSGKFDWAASPRFKADFVDPDPSYHGVSYTGAFGNLAFILKARVTLLRDLGRP
jgi:O-acetylhomoserine (thiol)-lyase